MKHKLKKIFENAVWWSGVVTIGIVLGISLQFVKAWTEPTVAPPNGNVGAPINTSDVGQTKWGPLQVLGFTLFNDPVESGVDVTGKVLTAQNAYGATAWAQGTGGGGGTYTAFGTTTCAAGWTVAYTGEGVFGAIVNGGYPGGGTNIFCLNGGLDSVKSASPPSPFVAYSGWVNGDEISPGGSGAFAARDFGYIECAVCVK